MEDPFSPTPSSTTHARSSFPPHLVLSVINPLSRSLFPLLLCPSSFFFAGTPAAATSPESPLRRRPLLPRLTSPPSSPPLSLNLQSWTLTHKSTSPLFTDRPSDSSWFLPPSTPPLFHFIAVNTSAAERRSLSLLLPLEIPLTFLSQFLARYAAPEALTVDDATLLTQHLSWKLLLRISSSSVADLRGKEPPQWLQHRRARIAGSSAACSTAPRQKLLLAREHHLHRCVSFPAPAPWLHLCFTLHCCRQQYQQLGEFSLSLCSFLSWIFHYKYLVLHRFYT